MEIKLGAKIKELRKEKDITQNALAKFLNVSNQTVSKWENDVSLPDIQLVPEIATFFEISVDELFNYKQIQIKEVQIERFYNVIINFYDLSILTRARGLLAIEAKLKDYNQLMNYGLSLTLNGMAEGMDLCMKNMCKNGYSTGNEVLDECIITGILQLNRGVNPLVMTEILLTFVPKVINNEVSILVRKKQNDDINSFKAKFFSNKIDNPPFKNTGLLEFLIDLEDSEIQNLLRQCNQLDLKIALFGVSVSVREKILNNLSHVISNDIINDMSYYEHLNLDFIKGYQQKILDLYNRNCLIISPTKKR